MVIVAETKQHEDTQLMFTNTAAALHEMNNALTGRVVLLEHITDELRERPPESQIVAMNY